MTTLEVESALMSRFLNVRQNIVVPNVSWGIGGLHECDLLSLTKAGYATEIEIKISKADLLKDKLKTHQHRHKLIKYLYFAVPKKLQDIALQEIPERAGLYVLEQLNNRIYINIVRNAIANSKHIQWTPKQMLHLAHLGTMRIVRMKQRLIELKQQNNNFKKQINERKTKTSTI